MSKDKKKKKKTKKTPHIKEIKCIRALDGLISGAFMVALFMFFSPMLMTFPITIIRYFYLIPILFVFIVIFTIPQKLHKTEKWRQALGRLRLFAFLTLGFAPFWVWWHNSPNTPYFLTNIACFIFCQVLCMYNMISMVSSAAEDDGNEWFFLFTRFARLALIYVLIAPILAFFFTVWLGFNGGRDIFLVLFQLKGWDIVVFGVPFALTIYILWHWRLILVHHVTGKKDKTDNEPIKQKDESNEDSPQKIKDFYKNID